MVKVRDFWKHFDNGAQQLLAWSSGLWRKVYEAPVTFGWSSGPLGSTLTNGAPVTLGLEIWALGKKYMERQELLVGVLGSWKLLGQRERQ